MHRRLVFLALAVPPLLFFAPRFAAAGAVYGPGVGFHIGNVIPPNAACTPPGLLEIDDAISETTILDTPDGPFHYLYVLGCNFQNNGGLGGIKFGVNGPGGYNPDGGERPICIFGWTLCAAQEFPSAGWPDLGTSNLILWPAVECNQPPATFVFKIAGYFYMGAYEPAQASITPHQDTGKVEIGDCQGNILDVTVPPPFEVVQGTAGFAMAGWPACLGIPLAVEPTTWGRLKSLVAE